MIVIIWKQTSAAADTVSTLAANFIVRSKTRYNQMTALVGLMIHAAAAAHSAYRRESLKKEEK